jgi:hypothetical protein
LAISNPTSNVLLHVSVRKFDYSKTNEN